MKTSRSLVARLPTVKKWFWCEFATEAGLSVLCPLSEVVLCGTLGCGISCSRFLVIIFPPSWDLYKSEYLKACIAGWLGWLAGWLGLFTTIVAVCNVATCILLYYTFIEGIT